MKNKLTLNKIRNQVKAKYNCIAMVTCQTVLIISKGKTNITAYQTSDDTARVVYGKQRSEVIVSFDNILPTVDQIIQQEETKQQLSKIEFSVN